MHFDELILLRYNALLPGDTVHVCGQWSGLHGLLLDGPKSLYITNCLRNKGR